jgi:hypothetical protein
VGGSYQIRLSARIGAACLCLGLCTWRASGVVHGLQGGDEQPLLAFPLAVILPAVLVAILVMLPPTETREGLLMRIGTIAQLLLIIALPSLALYLALGLPVVFLVAELIETWLPPALRDRLAGLVLT